MSFINIYELVRNRERKMAVIGMGYVGMPLALAFSKKADVIGYDINPEKIELFKNGVDPTGEVGSDAIKGSDVFFTAEESELGNAAFFIVAVPTPVNQDETPDLKPLIDASRIVGRHITPGSLVVYESTVYPGVTEDVCMPVLEEQSGLKCGRDFKIGYSPERVSPGDKVHRLENIIKIVSAIDEESLEHVAGLYELVIDAGVYKAGSIKVAEAAKVVENSQRDINIAFVNELAMALDLMDIDTREVLDAACSKWNFMNFRPGLVGGHCIGVDPYYFLYEAKKLGYNSRLIAPGRQINNGMSAFIADKTIRMLIQAGKKPKNANVFIFGASFKENCPDVRNSKVVDIYRHLNSYGIKAKFVDPVADEEDFLRTYGMKFTTLDSVTDADCLIFAVAHEEFLNIPFEGICRLFRESDIENERIIVDIKGILDKKKLLDAGYGYWRL